MPKFFGTFAALVPSAGTAVDLGAGDGTLAQKLAAAGTRVIAVDRKEPPIRLPNLEWAILPIEQWAESLPTGFTADAFLLKTVLQFINKTWALEVLLPALAAHLKPGGVIGIETFYAPSQPPLEGHISFYRTEELLKPFAEWHVVLREEKEGRAKDMLGNPRTFSLSRIIARKPA